MISDPILDPLNVSRAWRFKRRPIPLAGSLRPVWLIMLTLLCLNYCRGKRASLQTLHVITWSAKDSASQAAFLKTLSGEPFQDIVVPRIEPSLNRALDFAFAEGLIELQGKSSIKLTSKGLGTVDELNGTLDCMAAEKAFLKELQPYMSGKTLQGIIDGIRKV